MFSALFIHKKNLGRLLFFFFLTTFFSLETAPIDPFYGLVAINLFFSCFGVFYLDIVCGISAVFVFNIVIWFTIGLLGFNLCIWFSFFESTL